jgi:hypothetical protein
MKATIVLSDQVRVELHKDSSMRLKTLIGGVLLSADELVAV